MVLFYADAMRCDVMRCDVFDGTLAMAMAFGGLRDTAGMVVLGMATRLPRLQHLQQIWQAEGGLVSCFISP